MLVLIDSDSLCYANAFAVEEKDDEGNPQVIENGKKFLRSKLDQQIQTIVEETQATDYKLFLTGKGDFRKDMNPLYKANRVDMRRPILLAEARQHLIESHFAIVVNGMEADDMVCIEQTAIMAQGNDCTIAHIDKDIDQQAGNHYRWSIFGKDSVSYHVSEHEGLLNLYRQALVGDKVDNIMYYFDEEGSKTWKKCYGLGAKGAEAMLTESTCSKDMYEELLETYTTNSKFIRKDTGEQCTEEDLEMNMHMLYMKRTEDDAWVKP